MGWSSWNPYHAGQMGLDEKGIRAQADAMVSSGMAAVGYSYINIDDLWANRSRGADGAILPSHAFPSGMKALATYVHSKGLKFGLYSDVGTKTCGGQPGSFGHECADAAHRTNLAICTPVSRGACAPNETRSGRYKTLNRRVMSGV